MRATYVAPLNVIYFIWRHFILVFDLQITELIESNIRKEKQNFSPEDGGEILGRNFGNHV